MKDIYCNLSQKSELTKISFTFFSIWFFWGNLDYWRTGENSLKILSVNRASQTFIKQKAHRADSKLFAANFVSLWGVWGH